MHQLRKIREACGLSIGNFAKCIGLKKATYQCYEESRRTVPPDVIQRAHAQLERTRAYWSGMDARFDDELKGRCVQNEAR